MTDALWNGIIGAGGAAICCAVYFGFKAARKGFSKIKFSKSQLMPEQNSELPNIDTTATSASKQVTITLPTRKQIFTRNNIRCFCFLIIAVYAIYAAYAVGHEYYPYHSTAFYPPENSNFYEYTTAQLDTVIRLNDNLIDTIQGCFFWICLFVAMIFATLGLTGFKFKK